MDSKKKKKKVIKKKTIHKKSFKKELLKKIKLIKKYLNKKINKYKKKPIKKKQSKQTNMTKRREEIEELSKMQEELQNKSSDLLLENQKTLIFKVILFIVVLTFMVALIILALTPKKEDNKEKLQEIGYKEYENLYKNKDLNYIYITEDNCTYCELLEPYIFRLQTEFKIKFNTLNISKITESERNKLLKSNSVFSDNYSLPLLLSIKEGTEISNIKGYKEYQVLKKFVEYSNNPKENNSFIKINVNRYLDILKSSDLSIIYIGRDSSKSCETFASVLEGIATEYSLKVYYLDTDTLDTNEEWEKINTSNELFEKEWFVPTLLITKDNKVLAHKMETMNQSDLLYFLTKNKIVED